MELTLRSVSELLNAPEATVTRWIKQRGLPAQHVGGQYRVNRAELLEWATANRVRVSLELFDHLESEAEAAPCLAEALEAGGIHYQLRDTNKRPGPSRVGAGLAVARRRGPGTAPATLPRAGGLRFDRYRRRHRHPPRAEPHRPARFQADDHAGLSFAAGRFRGTGWQAGPRPVLHHQPDESGVTCSCCRGCPSPCTTRSFGRP